MNHRPGYIFNQKRQKVLNPRWSILCCINVLDHSMNHHHEEDDEWWNDCEENAVHQFSSMPSENDGNTTDLRRWWYNCEEHYERWWWHDDMTTWWHNNKIFIMKDDGFMMTWWQTWLEGKTRWPLVDWGAVRDSVLEGDRCCAKRYRKWQFLNSWLNIYA